MKSKIFIFAIVSLLLFCTCKQERKAYYTDIEIELQKGAKKIVCIEEVSTDKTLFIDSLCANKKGKISYRFYFDTAVFLRIRAGKDFKNYVYVIPQNKETLKIKALYDSLTESAIFSSSLQNAPSLYILPLQKKVRQNLYFFDSICRIWEQSMYNANAAEIRLHIDSLYNAQKEDQKKMQMQIIEENKFPLAVTFAKYQLFGNKPVLE